METTCCIHCSYSEPGNRTAPPRVVELFAGIGGWRHAIKMSKIFDGCSCSAQKQGVDFLDVFAVDVSEPACNIYKHNFRSDDICCKGIESFDWSIFEGKGTSESSSPTAILAMSPPCQPFTRIGLKRDLDDRRTNGLKHVCDLLKKCSQPCRPRMIVVENVAGFETSSARSLLVQTLITCGYEWRELLLTPFDFAIPNTRLRYYLAAALSDPTANAPDCPPASKIDIPAFVNSGKEDIPRGSSGKTCPVADFLAHDDIANDMFLTVEKHKRYLKVLDIVTPNSERSMCFTSSYGRYMEGTGSVLDILANTQEMKSGEDNGDGRNILAEREALLEAERLRFFSPREVANLMCFPPDFGWPSSSTNRHLYKCLGNSINCRVAAYIVQVAANILQTNLSRNRGDTISVNN